MIGKNLFDRLASLLGLLLLSPLLAVIAALIRVKMPDGAVLFRQRRVGRHGRLFTMYKFRTMAASHSGNPISVKGESRITPLGATLRKYKLDELPELWNVLRGDMSLVGPRPDLPRYTGRLRGEERRILEVRPGITCPASLKYRNEEELLASLKEPGRYNDEIIFPDKVRMNIDYINNRSFVYDIKIILYTLIRKDL
ncbi:MAG: sugar transferase [Tannerellaceae bacterium]|jgi:lipopolysaccharide/colanic/teichoic acid biosynthesis glycosyltransferase|nr:sugar transferase [Tannerellaceae bacterium]